MESLILSRIIIIFIFSQALFANEVCLTNKEGKIQYILDKKKVEVKSAYCFEETTKSILSLRCKVNKKCDALKFKKNKRAFNSSTGSPGFKLCQQVYFGTPQIIQFWTGVKWINTDRCIFSDQTYIDIGRLSANSY